MGKDSSIEWCDATFNPWWGCVKVSPGCESCYAEMLSNRFGHNVWGPAKTTPRREFGDRHWAEPLAWNAAAVTAQTRRRVFCASMADVFEDHPQLDYWRMRLWDLIEATPMLDWLLLTKRPENMRGMLPALWIQTPMPNIWLGTSCESQEQFDKRITPLLSTPAAIHFLSCEPLIGPIDMRGYRPAWVICGGESGPGARPAHPNWFRSLRDQCQERRIAFFHKQWGEWAPYECGPGYIWHSQHGDIWEQDESFYDKGLVLHNNKLGFARVGKKAAGRLLDGRTWDQFPGEG